MKEYEDIFNTNLNNNELQNSNDVNNLDNNVDTTQYNNFTGYSDQIRNDLEVKDEVISNEIVEEPIKENNVYSVEQPITNKEPDTQYTPMEHPDAKIVLNKVEESEEQTDAEEVEDINIIEEFKSNKSLLFVLGIGIVILVTIVAIPFISKIIGY